MGAAGQASAASSRVLMCGEDLGGDGGQLVNLPLGQHREEVFVEVSQVSVVSRGEGSETLLGDGHGYCPAIGRVGGSSDEPVFFEATHDTRDAALAQRRAAAEFGHLHGVVVGEDGEEEQDLELVEGDAVLVVEGAIESTEQCIAGPYEPEKGSGVCRLCLLGVIVPLYHFAGG